jgi:hypothetical protein
LTSFPFFAVLPEFQQARALHGRYSSEKQEDEDPQREEAVMGAFRGQA